MTETEESKTWKVGERGRHKETARWRERERYTPRDWRVKVTEIGRDRQILRETEKETIIQRAWKRDSETG